MFAYRDRRRFSPEEYLSLEERSEIKSEFFEVLSPGTEVYDRGEKFLFYQSLPSFQEYLVVGQDRPFAESHLRQSPAQWLSTTYGDRSQTVELVSLGVKIPLDSIYRGVVL